MSTRNVMVVDQEAWGCPADIRAVCEEPAGEIALAPGAMGRPSGPGWHGRDEFGKLAFDFALAAAISIPAVPVVLGTMALIRVTSPGPALYSQTRVGRNGRPFTIYKLRSMRHDCERDTGPLWASSNDSRVTPLGRFLRRTHLDELPQLWNVLRGEMSLVGPRPERPEFVTQLEQALHRYGQRHGVRPGVTGLAQVQLPPDTDLTSVRNKLACDLHYIETRGLWLDLRIVAVTALKVIGVPCESSCRLFRIPGGDAIVEAFRDGMASPPRDAAGPSPPEARWSLGCGQPPDTKCAPA